MSSLSISPVQQTQRKPDSGHYAQAEQNYQNLVDQANSMGIPETMIPRFGRGATASLNGIIASWNPPSPGAANPFSGSSSSVNLSQSNSLAPGVGTNLNMNM